MESECGSAMKSECGRAMESESWRVMEIKCGAGVDAHKHELLRSQRPEHAGVACTCWRVLAQAIRTPARKSLTLRCTQVIDASLHASHERFAVWTHACAHARTFA
eukprot:546881-Pleurochrysis_carterae.AAC.1